MPMHAAPSGTQKDLVLGFAINANSTTPPTFDNTVGWTQLTLPSDGLGAGIGSNTSSIAFAKYATTSAEAFGTHTGALRCLCAVFRLSVAPALLDDAFAQASGNAAISFDNKAAGAATNHWEGLTWDSGDAHIFTLMLARIIQAVAHRSDTINQNNQSSGSNRLAWATSNGLVGSWSDQAPAVAGSTETLSISVGIIP
jgi:hypothetical protein